MARLRPGWFVALCAALLAGSAWLPWLMTSAAGGGHASAIGGTVGSIVLPPRFGAGQLIVLLSSVLIVTGAMAARNFSPRLAATAALVISALIAILTWFYYQLNVSPPVSAGYGLYVGAACALGALMCSVWALAAALLGGRSMR
jgi:roadblock/LC7 domain-containing protein